MIMVERRYPGWEGASVSNFWGGGPFDSAALRSERMGGGAAVAEVGLTRSFDCAPLRCAPFRFAQDERRGAALRAGGRGGGLARCGWLTRVLRLRCAALCSVPLRSGRTEVLVPWRGWSQRLGDSSARWVRGRPRCRPSCQRTAAPSRATSTSTGGAPGGWSGPSVAAKPSTAEIPPGRPQSPSRGNRRRW